jgi:hypothetical protein
MLEEMFGRGSLQRRLAAGRGFLVIERGGAEDAEVAARGFSVLGQHAHIAKATSAFSALSAPPRY